MKSFIFFYISCYLVLDYVAAQSCSKSFTFQRLISKLSCSGFEGTLNFDVEVDEGVEYIDLSNNDITNINKESFSKSLDNILRIYINNNDIRSVGPKAFKRLPNLELLDLSYNSVTHIDPEIFSANKRLVIIDLTGNQIQTLDIEIVIRLNSLEELILTVNPIEVCDRKTSDALGYLEKRDIKTYLLASCDGLIEDKILIPDTAEAASNEPSLILIYIGGVLTVIIIISITVIFLYFIIFKKKKLNVFGSVKYRTINLQRLIPVNKNENCASTVRSLQSVSTSQDSDGYLIPNNPNRIPHYIEVTENISSIKQESSHSHRLLSPLPINVFIDRQSICSEGHVYEDIE